MAALKALLDVFPQLEELLIFSPMMVGEEAKTVEAFPHLRERRDVGEAETEADDPPDVVNAVPCTKAFIQWVNSVTLFFPPRDLVLGLVGFPLRCRELVLVEDPFNCDGDTFNLLLDSTGPTLESLTIRNTFDKGEVELPVLFCFFLIPSHTSNLRPPFLTSHDGNPSLFPYFSLSW